jgi:hypothetical protein
MVKMSADVRNELLNQGEQSGASDAFCHSANDLIAQAEQVLVFSIDDWLSTPIGRPPVQSDQSPICVLQAGFIFGVFRVYYDSVSAAVLSAI